MREELINELNQQLTGKKPEEVLEFFLDKYRGSIVQATSMGIEDQVITHMINGITKDVRYVTLDTGRLPQETYDLIQQTGEEYNITVELIFPDYKEVQKMTNQHGINLFYKSVDNRKLCCNIRKDEPIRRALKGQDAWICGLRKDQTVTRFFNKLVEWDTQHELIKVNPLINWTEKQVWEYLGANDVPVNVLHSRGYPSIGCKPCTRAVQASEDSRAGRWWWEKEEHKECGLHNRDLSGKKE